MTCIFILRAGKQVAVDYLVAERETLVEEMGEGQRGGKQVRLRKGAEKQQVHVIRW